MTRKLKGIAVATLPVNTGLASKHSPVAGSLVLDLYRDYNPGCPRTN
jgi:hypothetical protein